MPNSRKPRRSKNRVNYTDIPPEYYDDSEVENTNPNETSKGQKKTSRIRKHVSISSSEDDEFKIIKCSEDKNESKISDKQRDKSPIRTGVKKQKNNQGKPNVKKMTKMKNTIQDSECNSEDTEKLDSYMELNTSSQSIKEKKKMKRKEKSTITEGKTSQVKKIQKTNLKKKKLMEDLEESDDFSEDMDDSMEQNDAQESLKTSGKSSNSVDSVDETREMNLLEESNSKKNNSDVKQKQKKMQKQKQKKQIKAPTTMNTKKKNSKTSDLKSELNELDNEKKQDDDDEEDEEDDEEKEETELKKIDSITSKLISNCPDIPTPKSFMKKLQNMFGDILNPSQESTSSNAWKDKYKELYKLRMTEPEQLLQDVKELASEERRVYDEIIKSQKQKIENLEKQFTKKQKQQEISSLADVGEETILDVKNKHMKLTKENQNLRKQLATVEKELEELKHVSHEKLFSPRKKLALIKGTAGATSTASTISDMNVQIALLQKLIKAYQLITNIKISIIETDDDEMEEEENENQNEDILEVACKIVHPTKKKCFPFELAIPADENKDVDYYPEDKTENGPTFLKDEISFDRSQLPAFYKSLMEVLID